MLVGLAVAAAALSLVVLMHTLGVDLGFASKLILWISLLLLVGALVEPFVWLVGVWRGKSPLGSDTPDRHDL